MIRFYIEELVAAGKGHGDSIITFKPGLNIICGPSNTGKSYIVDCIDFMFGGKAPFDEATGYDTIRMTVKTVDDEIVQLERSIGSNIVKVYSTVGDVKSGDYGRKNGPTLSALWLSLIGIKEGHQILVNENFEPKALTWRTFLHMLLIKEENVFQKPSIVRHTGFSVPTAPLSALLFLMKGLDFSEFLPTEKPEVKAAKKKAVINYINKQMLSLGERQGMLNDELQGLSDVDVEKEMRRIVDQIEQTEAQIAIASKKSRGLLESIYSISAKLEENRFLQERYGALDSQYVADMKRLEFVIESEKQAKTLPHNQKCPFCDSEIAVPELESVAAISESEEAVVGRKLRDLREVEEAVAKEQESLEKELSTLKKENSGVIMLINTKLNPLTDELRKKLATYRAYHQTKREMEVVRNLSVSMDADLFAMENEEEETTAKYKPREHFDSDFSEKMTSFLSGMLEKCKYEHLLTSRFSLDSFDAVVNGRKKENEGKGFRAFLNTAMAFTLMKYLSTYAKYVPGILIIDSPILSLKEKNEEHATDSMKSSLFQYFLDNQAYGQVIIIENDIPKLDYQNAHVIRFTMDEKEGRYGFLNGVRN